MSARIDIPRRRLRDALHASDGFMARAARRLGVHRLVVYRRARDLGLLPLAQRLRAATGWEGGPPLTKRLAERPVALTRGCSSR